MDTICCFNVKKNDGKIVGWTVPVDLKEIPKGIEDMADFEKTVRDLTPQHIVLDCYAIFDTDYKPLFKTDDFTDEDFVEVFEVGTFYER